MRAFLGSGIVGHLQIAESAVHREPVGIHIGQPLLLRQGAVVGCQLFNRAVDEDDLSVLVEGEIIFLPCDYTASR